MDIKKSSSQHNSFLKLITVILRHWIDFLITYNVIKFTFLLLFNSTSIKYHKDNTTLHYADTKENTFINDSFLIENERKLNKKMWKLLHVKRVLLFSQQDSSYFLKAIVNISSLMRYARQFPCFHIIEFTQRTLPPMRVYYDEIDYYHWLYMCLYVFHLMDVISIFASVLLISHRP